LISTQNFRVEHGLQVGDVVIDAASGIVSATSFFGDGSGLTGVGGSSGAIIACCTSNFISCNTSLPSITSAENNFFVGFNAGNGITSGSCNNFFGFNAGRGRKGITSIGITSSTTLIGEANNTYSDVSGTGGDGSNATFSVERDGNGDVFTVDIVIGGQNYNVGNTLTIDGADVGGSSGTDDITFTIDTVEGSTGSDNNFFGRCAGLNNTTGSYNNFFGEGAGKDNTTGCGNNFFGKYSGYCNTTGYGNNYIGAGAGLGNTTGCANTYMGYLAGVANSTGSYNNFFGFGAGVAASGCSNNFFGIFAGSSFLPFLSEGEYNSGCYNNFFGSQSGILNTTGCNNNFFGNLSGAANTTGSNNNFFGFGAGSNNTTGSYNIAIGDNVQLPNVSGNNQLAIGVSNTSWINGDENFNVGIGTTNPQTKLEIGGVLGFSDRNVRIGDIFTGSSITTGNNNNFIGVGAGSSNTTGSCNNFFGLYAGYYSTTGSCNNFFGCSAGRYNTTGSRNNFLGTNAGRGRKGRITSIGITSFTTLVGEANNSYLNVFGTGGDGFDATFSVIRDGNGDVTIVDIVIEGQNYNEGNTLTIDGFTVGGSSVTDDIVITINTVEGSTGSCNNFLGSSAGRENTTGFDNNFFGSCAGKYNTTGCGNNFLGNCAGFCNTTGCYNNFFGAFAGSYNTTGSYNNFFGYQSGIANTTGSSNNFFGRNAGSNNTTGCYNNFFGICAGFCNTTGCYNNFFGRNVGCNNTTGNNNTFLGNYSGISTSASNKIIFGSGVDANNLFDSPDATKDTQFAVGIRTDANDSKYWLVGDENFNVGIGATSPTSKLTVTGDVLVSGVVTATSFVGDGSGLTNLPTPSRITVTGITEIISSSGIGNTDIFGFKTYSILKVGISTAAWIRIYTDSDSRSNDASRPINIDPTSGSGIVAEFVSAGATTIKTGPVPIGYNDDDPEENIIYMSVNNLSGISTSIEVNLTILKMEE
jgi:hypothetical protein